MALIDRLMGLAPDGVTPDPQGKISVHEFAAACFEVAFGPRTVAEMKSYYTMSAEDATELDALIAKVTGTDAIKHRVIFMFEQVLILAESKVTGYTTPALVRARLGV